MDADDKQHVLDCIENEGFDYCFTNYSFFSEIEDEQFHRLRKNYIAAQEALSQYLEVK